MEDQVWLWQDGSPEPYVLDAVAVGDNGIVLLAGVTGGSWGGSITAENDTEMVATMLQLTDSGVTELWRWQEGSGYTDTMFNTRFTYAYISAAALTEDGSGFLAGTEAVEDIVFRSTIFHLNSTGDSVWEWKGNSEGGDVIDGMVLVGDGSGDIYAAGYMRTVYRSNTENFVVYRVSSAGTVWKWQGGHSSSDRLNGAASVDEGNAVVLVGGTSFGLVAVKLDSDGNELWTWEDQDLLADTHTCDGVAAASNTSVVLACTTAGGDTGVEYSYSEQTDFLAVMLNSTNGEEIWRWQGGTTEDDSANGVAVTDFGYVVLAGYTRGDWTTQNLGGSDLAVVMLRVQDGSVIAGWQGGSTGNDQFLDVAGTSWDNVVCAGYITTNSGGQDFAAKRSIADFWETPMITSSPATVTDEEESSHIPSFVTGLLVVLAVCAVIICWGYLSRERKVGSNRDDPADQQELDTARHARVEGDASGDDAPPVALPVTVTGGGGVPCVRAVAVPARGTMGGRVWTVVAAEVVER